MITTSVHNETIFGKRTMLINAWTRLGVGARYGASLSQAATLSVGFGGLFDGSWLGRTFTKNGLDGAGCQAGPYSTDNRNGYCSVDNYAQKMHY